MRHTTNQIILVLIVLAGSATSQSTLDIRKLMSADEFQHAGLQKLNEQEVAVLNMWLLKFAVTLKSADGGGDQSFADLEGTIIVADDGQFLGKITTNSIDRTSILNTIGPYGSEISSTSIFNNISKYGSDISRLSPFNDITSTPPRIFKGERFIGYLTTNTIKTPRVDPRALVGWLKSQE